MNDRTIQEARDEGFIDPCDTCEYNSLDWHEEPCESCTGADNHWKPPTQSNTSKALEALDCISRAAAIDAIQAEADEAKEVWSEFDDESAFGQMNAHSRDIDIIKRLPSAQPETAKRIVGKSRDGMTLWYQCDMCNEPVDAHDIFCRGCGRRLIDE